MTIIDATVIAIVIVAHQLFQSWMIHNHIDAAEERIIKEFLNLKP